MTDIGMTDTKPTVDLPLKQAIKNLTGFEVIAISGHFGKEFEALGGINSLIGTIWAYENRGTTVEWAHVKGMTLQEMEDYFAPEVFDADPSDPDSDQGKG